MIDVRNLTKDYGTVVAVRDLSFEVGAGEVVGFLGPNGAGKSTTLRILGGFLGATTGSVSINGFDIVDDSLKARGCIGYMPEACPLYPEMRTREYLRFRAEAKGVSRSKRSAAIDRAMELARVSEMADTLIQHLSKGYRQRVGLADALVSTPPLLILDEPTAGLDPNQIRDVRTVIRELGDSHTILLSTHILSEVEATCDRAIVIDRGELQAEGTIDELRDMRRAAGARLVLGSLGSSREEVAVSTAEDVPGVFIAKVEPSHKHTVLTATFDDDIDDAGAALAALVAALVAAGFDVREAAPTKASLEDVFAQLTVGAKS